MRKSLTFFVITLFLLLSAINVSAQQSTIWGVGVGGKATYEINTSFILHSSNETLLPNMTIENQTSITMGIIEQANDGYRYKLVSETNTTYGLVTFKTFSTSGGDIIMPVGDFPFVLPLAYGNSENFLKDFGESWKLMNQMAFMFGNGTEVTANSTLDNNGLTLLLKMVAHNLTIEDLTSMIAFITLPQVELSNQVNASNAIVDVSVFYAKKTGLLENTDIGTIMTADIYINDTESGTVLMIPQNNITINSTIKLTQFLNPGNVETRESLPFSLTGFLTGIFVVSIIYIGIRNKMNWS